MKKFMVEYVHQVEITYRVPVLANSEEEAKEKVEDMHSDVDFFNEEEIDWQGVYITAKNAEEAEDNE